MATIITFPAGRHVCNNGRRNPDEEATIIILPVVRIDRYGEEPRDGLRNGRAASARKGRRPTARR